VTETHPGLAGGPIYLDYNATTPVDPRVAEAALPYVVNHFGNPSSTHAYGERPRRAVDGARDQVASLVGGTAGSVIFTGNGSEANNLAIRGAIVAARIDSPHVITQQSEHPAVLTPCRAAERLGLARVTYLPVDQSGLVDPAALEAAITPETTLVSVMHANNETGVVQPIAELAHIAHRHGALFHTDAAQTVGKIPVDVTELDVDLLSIVGHKMYAPKGVGALYVRPGTNLEPLIYGGGQEKNIRGGTENVAAIAALGKAAELAEVELARQGPRQLSVLRDRLYDELVRRTQGFSVINGHPDRRLPHVLNVSLAGIRADDLLAAVPGVAAATGSACHAGSDQDSPTLVAMGYDVARIRSALRLSLGRWTTRDDVDRAAELLGAAYRRLTIED
jgi:cysteine desulfurase